DKSGLVSESNLTGAYMLGAERNDVIQNKFSQFIAPESQDIFYHHRQRILESGLRDTFELKLVKKDGTPFYAQMKCIPMKDCDGKLSRIRALMIDISERKKAKEAILLFRTLVNQSNDALFVIDPKTNRFLESNEKACTDLKYEKKELLNLGVVDIDAAIPDELAWEEHVKEVRKKGSMLLEGAHKRKDGTKFPVEVHVKLILEKKEEYMVAVARDISVRKQTEEQIRKLTHQLIKTQENERHMISLELHDRIAQDLIGLKYACETLLSDAPSIPDEINQKCLNFLQMLEKSISEVRNLSYDLRPPGLDKLGLVKTLYQYASEFSEKTSLPVDFHSAGLENLTLDYDTKINLYRLVQEGLNNVRKHANASHVTVKLVASFPNILLRISDDGKGFDVEERMRQIDSNKKMGLRSMEERVLLLKGKMTIQSKSAEGTKILIEVPFEEKTHAPKKDHTDR
ncbi:MAG: PAS domain S-box protein, partial [Deltaproteobacteria bacterium]|nr:PAS domain S-box protein [Deltaproteobacteria bacterium]